jgi:hypothetical protein
MVAVPGVLPDTTARPSHIYKAVMTPGKTPGISNAFSSSVSPLIVRFHRAQAQLVLQGG